MKYSTVDQEFSHKSFHEIYDVMVETEQNANSNVTKMTGDLHSYNILLNEKYERLIELKNLMDIWLNLLQLIIL